MTMSSKACVAVGLFYLLNMDGAMAQSCAGTPIAPSASISVTPSTPTNTGSISVPGLGNSTGTDPGTGNIVQPTVPSNPWMNAGSGSAPSPDPKIDDQTNYGNCYPHLDGTPARQYSSTIDFPQSYGESSYSGPTTDLDTVLQSTSWIDGHSGFTYVFHVDVGCYLSLQFTASPAGSLQFVANQTFGSGGTLSMSTTPGDFSAECSIDRNGANNLEVETGTAPLERCHVLEGSTYYINIGQTGSTCTELASGKGGDGSGQQSCSIALTYYSSAHP